MDMKNRSDQIHRDQALLFEAYMLLVRYYDQEYKVTLISDKLDIHRAIGNITIKIKSVTVNIYLAPSDKIITGNYIAITS